MGRRIEARRKEAGLTQAGLALAIGVDQTTVSRWEGGLVPIDTDDLEKLSKVLQARGGWLVDASGAAPAPFVRVAHDRPSARSKPVKRKRA